MDTSYLRRCFDYLSDDRAEPPVGPVSAGLAWLARLGTRSLRLFGLDLCWLPDVVVWLDVSPAESLRRIDVRGKALDAHENEADLAQARSMYATTIKTLQQAPDGPAVIVLRTDGQSQGQTLRALVQALTRRLARIEAPTARPSVEAPLGTTDQTTKTSAVLRKLLDPRYHLYMVRYLLQHAWRELSFPLSGLGRQLLVEGYSASMMRSIYAQQHQRYSLLDRVFLGYPLHRAVYDRWQILVPQLAQRLRERLAHPGTVRIFTAPSGLADDIFGALEQLAAEGGHDLRRVHLVAADLDPAELVAGSLQARAAALGVRLSFFRGDLASPAGRSFMALNAPYDLALFVGLSSWLPKPQMIQHLRALARMIRADGVLVSDCFTAAPYAISGQLMGYKASYYQPRTYAALLAYCGFVVDESATRGGRDRINYVMQLRLEAGTMVSARAA